MNVCNAYCLTCKRYATNTNSAITIPAKTSTIQCCLTNNVAKQVVIAKIPQMDTKIQCLLLSSLFSLAIMKIVHVFITWKDGKAPLELSE
jgi:hypothetical protein